jgi:hypothetical protein
MGKEMRDCPTCGKCKRKDEFYRSDWRCKECKKEAMRSAREEKKKSMQTMMQLVKELEEKVSRLSVENQELRSAIVTRKEIKGIVDKRIAKHAE